MNTTKILMNCGDELYLFSDLSYCPPLRVKAISFAELMFCFYDVYLDKETAEFLCLNCILEKFLLRKTMFNLQVCFV